MTVKTKSIYDTKRRIDGLRVLVSRFYPRGVMRDHFDLWVREASPKPDLLRAYKHGSINWPEFERRFRLQLRTATASISALNQLSELSTKRIITLLCYEKEWQKCHRQILKRRLDALSKRNKRLAGQDTTKSP